MPSRGAHTLDSQISLSSDIAVKACYAAPLERHHLSSAFALLARKDGILSGFDLVDRKQLQTWMRELVLATDFGAHHAVISEFKTMLDLRGVVGDASGAPVAVDRRMSSESLRIASRSFEGDEKILALKMAIKTADLGYLTKGEKACHVWTSSPQIVPCCLLERSQSTALTHSRAPVCGAGLDRARAARVLHPG